MTRIILVVAVLAASLAACAPDPTSNDIQREQSERLLSEGTSQVGMPAIKNFRERKLLKDIYELRDQSGLVTYTYLENLIPTVVKGHTALGGKLTFFCESFGYPIPYATQFTAPEAVQRYNITGEKGSGRVYGTTRLPQADPNGLFSPASTNGTWIMCKDPDGGKDVKPLHVEPNLVGSPFKFPLD